MILRLILAFSMAFSTPLAMAQSSDQVNAMERKAYLEALMLRAEKMYEFNTVHLNFLEKCFSGDEHPDCQKETDRIRNNIELRYDKLQQHLLTYTLVNVAYTFIELYIAQATARELGKPIKKMPFHRTGLRSFVNLLSGAKSVTRVPSFEPSGEEIQYYLKDAKHNIIYTALDDTIQSTERAYSVSGYLKHICDEYQQRKTQSPTKKSLCDRFDLTYSPKDEAFTFKNAVLHPDELTFVYELVEYSKAASPRLADDIRMKYFNAVTEHPYVGLVEDIHPSDEELAELFREMAKNSCMELVDVKKTRNRALGQMSRKYVCVRAENLEVKTAVGYTGWVVKEKKRPKKRRGPRSRAENPDAALEFMSFSRIIDKVVEEPSKDMKRLSRAYETDFNQVVAGLISSYGWLGMKQFAKTMGLTVAAMGVCLLPWGRIAKLGVLGKSVYEARIIKRSKGARKLTVADFLCMAGTGYAVNTFFLNEAFEEYQRTYRRVFSSETGETLLIEMKDLATQEQFYLLEKYLQPVGVVPLGIIGFYGARLSKQSFQLAKKIMIRGAP